MVYSWLVLSLAAMGLSDHSFLVVASVEGLEIHQHIYPAGASGLVPSYTEVVVVVGSLG